MLFCNAATRDYRRFVGLGISSPASERPSETSSVSQYVFESTHQERHMKKAMYVTLLSATLCSTIPISLSAFAGDEAAAPAAAHAMPSTEDVMKKMTDKLSLSEDQAAKITPIVQDRQEKLKAIQADTSASKQDKQHQAKTVFSDSDAQIKAILTPAQQQKYVAMKQQMHGQAKSYAQRQQ
jgi:periplasmic protein CpxP/Spy